MSWHHAWLVVFAVICTLASLWARYLCWSWFESIASNLAAGFMGSFAVVLFVDRAIRKAQEARDRRFVELALTRLKVPLVNQLQFLHDWHKASSASRPVVMPSTLAEVLAPGIVEDMRRLDFSQPAPVLVGGRRIPWWQFAPSRFNRFSQDIRTTLDAYAVYLEPDLVELLEGMVDNAFVGSVSVFPAITADPDWVRTVSPCFMISPSYREIIGNYLSKIVALANEFNNRCRVKVGPESLSLWRDNVDPQVGDSRIPDAEAQRLERQLPDG